MTERELIDWLRFEGHHEPLPDRLSDIHHAVLVSVTANLQRGPDTPAFTAADFFVIRQPQPAPRDDGLTEVERQMRNWRGDG